MVEAQRTFAHIGSIAWQKLAQAQTARIWGITSRGVFLHLASDWLVFLSLEQWRGPLTLNLSPAATGMLRNLSLETAVEIHPSRLCFERPPLQFTLDEVPAWSAPPPQTGSVLSPQERQQRLETVSQHLNSPPGRRLPPVIDCASTSAALEQNLGLGEGLTPANDDLALGFLLAANRWGGLLCPEMELQSINQRLQQAAYQKTTLLSANLIECAAQGQADERLILALDSIITGKPGLDDCIASLSTWGSTSGTYALMGMGLAISIASRVTL